MIGAIYLALAAAVLAVGFRRVSFNKEPPQKHPRSPIEAEEADVSKRPDRSRPIAGIRALVFYGGPGPTRARDGACMRLLYLMAVATFSMSWPQMAAAQARDISRPMQVLKATVVAMVLGPLNRNGVDPRLGLEIALETELPVPTSLAEVRAMSPGLQQAILDVCSQMMPIVENLDDIGGFPDVSGVRVTLRSKPVNAGGGGAGTYQTLIFPQDRGCKSGW